MSIILSPVLVGALYGLVLARIGNVERWMRANPDTSQTEANQFLAQLREIEAAINRATGTEV